MTEDDVVRRLLDWESHATSPLDGATRVLAHPQFFRAARTLAANMAAFVERDEVIAEVCKDAGRYVGTMAALHLHGAGGLTLPRLKEVAAATAYFSPGRARVILRFLEQVGYVSPGEPVGGRGARRYVPTDLFTTSWRDHHRAALEAAAIIEPAAIFAHHAIGDARAAKIFVEVQSEGLLRGASATTPMPFMQHMLHRHAGSHFAWMLLSVGAGDEVFPSRQPIEFSIAGIARRFDVSRVHIRRLIRDGVTAQLLDISPEGAVRFAACAHADIRFLYAAQLSQLLASAAGTMRRLQDQNCPVS